MKRQWETEELIEQFMLMPSELALLPDEITNATAHNRLGFAVLLKFFQVEGRFSSAHWRGAKSGRRLHRSAVEPI